MSGVSFSLGVFLLCRMGGGLITWVKGPLYDNLSMPTLDINVLHAYFVWLAVVLRVAFILLNHVRHPGSRGPLPYPLMITWIRCVQPRGNTEASENREGGKMYIFRGFCYFFHWGCCCWASRGGVGSTHHWVEKLFLACLGPPDPVHRSECC